MKIDFLFNLASILVSVTGAYWMLRSKIGMNQKDVVYLQQKLKEVKDKQSNFEKVFLEIQEIKVAIAVITEKLANKNK